MSNKDLDKIFGSIKKAINPELDIPADEQENPINYRIKRVREVVRELAHKHKEQALEIERLEVTLTALLQEINDK